MVVENQVDDILVVYFVGKVHVDCVGADVWVIGRVYACEVLVFDEYRAMCRGQWGESEWAMQVVTR